MSAREIITLQFGHYSNFIGAHYWNIQEQSFDYTGTLKTECNHDVLYREGQTINGETTYTPRLLLADLNGSLKTFPKSGGLPDDLEFNEEEVWDNVEKIEEPPPPKNEFLKDIELDSAAASSKDYNFDNEVESWTDFLYPRFHPRSVNIVTDYQHGNENESFDISTAGSKIWKSDFGELFGDNIRKYVEECDSMQGFVVNFDCTDGFSGIALACIEQIVDDYFKPILAHPTIASYFSDNNPSTPEQRDRATLKDSVRLANIALSIEGLSQHSSLFVPLCTSDKGWRKPGSPRKFDYLNYNPNLYYHSSALLASALDTLSFKYRVKSNDYTLSDMCADMTGYGRKMAAASLGMPLALDETSYLIDYLNEASEPLLKPITPSCKLGTDKLFQLVTVRGVPEHVLKAEASSKNSHIHIPAYRCQSVKEMFELYFQSNNFLSATNVTVGYKPLAVKNPYPKIFSESLSKYGYIINGASTDKVESIPVMAGYHNGTFISDMLEKLHRDVGRVKFSKLHKFTDEGLEEADFKESLDRLAEFKDNYEDDFNL